MKRKYIIFKDGSVKVFDTDQIHSFMTGGKEVESAGFFISDDTGRPIEVYGESTTIGVKARKEDLPLLRIFYL